MQFVQKHRRAFVRYLLVAVTMLSVMPVLVLSTGPALAAPGVTIPDENLRAALEQALGKSAGYLITVFELAQLPQLLVSHKSITDLTELELCTNLRELDLTNKNVSGISALASLTKLQSLYLKGNHLNIAAYAIQPH